MQIRAQSGAVAIVSTEYGERLVASGLWTKVEPPKPKRATRKKAEPKED